MKNFLSFLSIILFIVIGAIQTPSVAAFTSTNNNESIHIDDIDIAPTATPAIRPYKILPSLKPNQPTPVLQPKAVTPSNPKIFIQKYQNITNPYFSFGFAADNVDFGIVDPTNPVIRTHLIELSPGTTSGYTLLAYENHPMQLSQQSITIPDTTCDDGHCSESAASLWQNTLTYGFGYRCDDDSHTNPVCLPAFSDPASYKQFGDVSKNETGSAVLRGEASQGNLQARLTYKLNVPGTQKAGGYTNAIVYIATPDY